MRQTGTANIGSNLAQRGLLDSSLYPGALSNLEQNIAQTRNPMSDLYWQQALGLGQQAGNTIGNLSNIAMLRQLLGGSGGFGQGGGGFQWPGAMWDQYGNNPSPWSAPMRPPTYQWGFG